MSSLKLRHYYYDKRDYLNLLKAAMQFRIMSYFDFVRFP
jgi:hypothetical protein